MPVTRASDIDRISEALDHVLRGGTPAPITLPPDSPDDEIKQLTTYVNRFLEQYQLLAHAASAFCNGDVDVSLPGTSLHICQSLKNLQANLRHLTWCTAQVAEGDYSQRVDFMGEFSRSFNRMVETLDGNRTALLRRNRELEIASTTDALTGLLNRRGARQAIKREVARGARSGKPFGLVLVDIDHFKKVNDTFGHDAGDAVLVEVARAIQSKLRPQDHCARWGGEEFLAAITETDLGRMVLVAERVRLGVQAVEVNHGHHTLSVTVSVGVSLYEDGESISACLNRADHCLYLAKRSGRDQVCHWPPPATRRSQPEILETQVVPA